MALPRRAQMTLGVLCAILLAGLLGLLWWSWRHQRGGQPPPRFRRVRAALVVAALVTIAVGGVGTSADYYVGVPAAILGTRATNLGDIVLSPGYNNRAERAAVASHEARHRPQWAIATVIGGPLAFPVAYAIDDFFFPGSRNHFERLAGLESGGYSRTGRGPVLGPAQVATLGCLAAVVVVALFRALRRRRSPSSPPGEAKSDSP